MTLRRLQVSDFRCVQTADLQFDPKFTLITGANASGKTSLLEAVYVLSRGRSFRTRQVEPLIRSGTSRYVVFGEVDLSERSVSLGVDGSADGLRARVAGERVRSLVELAAALPVQIIDPEVHRLIEEGPSRRRRFIDWGVFHVEHAFVEHWQKYQQALRQRNTAMRMRQPRELVTAWDSELIRFGSLIDKARHRYVERLTTPACSIARSLLGMDLTLTYRSGWPRDLSLAQALESTWTNDYTCGSTTTGPQRAELSIRLQGSRVKDRISRGQQKLLAAALVLAQITLIPCELGRFPTLLLDDPAAELDDSRLIELIREIAQSNVQLVVTALTEKFTAFGKPGQQYRIDSGVVSAR